jgi:hypothetical protein
VDKASANKIVGHQMDADVKIALETLLRLCNKTGIIFGGMMMRLEGPAPFVTVVGNSSRLPTSASRISSDLSRDLPRKHCGNRHRRG